MIKSKSDLKRYIKLDLSNADYSDSFKTYIFNDIFAFLICLRKYEYYINIEKTSLIQKLIKLFYKVRHKRLGRKLGFDIAPNVFGPGLSLPHAGTIVVNGDAKIGKNCRIHVCVNIGADRHTGKCPIIGDNCYIGPGAKVFGEISLGDNISIGANSVVNKSFDSNVVIGGVPAKILKRID